MPTPAVRASTSTRAKPQEVYDKMTTVRGVSNPSGAALKRAIAEVIQATQAGTERMDNIRQRIEQLEKANRPKSRR